MIRASVTPKQGEIQPSFGDTLINNTRKQLLIHPITSSLSNCLSETNLHFTLPQLKSKIRGKVSTCEAVCALQLIAYTKTVLFISFVFEIAYNKLLMLPGSRYL